MLSHFDPRREAFRFVVFGEAQKVIGKSQKSFWENF